MKTATKTFCPRVGDVIHDSGREWTVTSVFPFIDTKTDEDGYTFLMESGSDARWVSAYDHDEAEIEVWR